LAERHNIANCELAHCQGLRHAERCAFREMR
jgi:hypothetical protein